MSSYNHEKYISEAIESVLNQNFQDFELVIVDDFSGDNSKTIIETYLKQDKRIKSIFHEKNMGIASTINDLFSKASGKYIALVASDDVWDHTKLEKQLKVSQKDDSLVVWCEGEVIDSKGSPVGRTFTEMQRACKKKKSGQILEELLDDNFIFGSSLFFKRELIRTLRLDGRLKYLNDYKFFIDLAENNRFFFIKEPLVKYRVHGRNTISIDNESWIRDRAIMGQYLLGKFGNIMQGDTKATHLKNIGKNYSFQNKKMAEYYFFQALKANLNPYYLMLVLTNGKIESLLLKLYKYRFSIFSSGRR